MTLDDAEYLTAEQVADRLRRDPDEVRSWIRRGTLPSANLGSAGWRVRRADLERFILAGRERERDEA
jgi:excisionase family DNA binding protein